MAIEEQALATDNLALKKKARRRLVGTVALVILSLLLLPQVLKNKSELAQPKEPIIYMPESPAAQLSVTEDGADVDSGSGLDSETIAHRLASEYGDQQLPDEATDTSNQESSEVANVPPQMASKSVVKATTIEAEKTTNQVNNKNTAQDKIKSDKTIAVKVSEQPVPKSVTSDGNQSPDVTAPTGYAVQIGVYANPDNVKKMQAKIALAGFESKTATLPQGTRLRVGDFVSRQGAEKALETLKQSGLTGRIVAK